MGPAVVAGPALVTGVAGGAGVGAAASYYLYKMQKAVM